MPERQKLEPAYDPVDWRDAETGDSGDDPLAELARLVQGIEKNSGSKPLRPAPPPRPESSVRQQPAMRYESYPSTTQSDPAPFVRAPAPDRIPSTADLASDLEAELMRELQASFNAVRAPMESPRQPEIPAQNNYDEVDFDAFAEVHFRRHAPMEAAPPPPPPPAGIESLATWREPTRPRMKSSGPSFRQRLAQGAAESTAPLRTSAEIRYDAADPLAADPEIAAVAAAAESFSQSVPERMEPPPLRYEPAAEDAGYGYVPGYGPPEGAYDDEEEHEVRTSSSRRPLMLVGGLLGVVIIGAAGFFAVTSFMGGDSGPPPLIAADSSPIKVRPENPGGTASSEQSKLIYDRVGGDTADASLAPDRTVTTVARPEAQQTDASREISRIILPNPTDPAMEDDPATAASAESDAVGPKRVRTVVVRPDGTIVSSTSAPAGAAVAPAAAAPAASTPPQMAAAEPVARSTSPAPAAREVAPVVPDEPAYDEPDDLGFADDWESDEPIVADRAPVGATKPAAAAAKPAAAVTTTTAAPAPKDTGPISLLPKSGTTTSEPAKVASVAPAAPAPEKPAAAAAAKPAAAPVAAAAATGAYFVQVSSQRSESAALAAYREVQRRFPSVLGSREPDIQRADLGSRGVYYRARVAPGLSGSEAVSLCTSLKNAGGDCIITQN